MKRIIFAITFVVLLAFAGCSKTAGDDNSINSGQICIQQTTPTEIPVPAVPLLTDMVTQKELEKYDYCLYRVNCADTMNTTEPGLFHSVSDSKYKEDPVTGNKWGYEIKEWMESCTDKSGAGLTACRWGIKEGTEYDNENTGFYYNFQLPEGTYEVKIGFYNAFSVRTVDICAEGIQAIDGLKLLKFQLVCADFVTDVTDGELNLKIYNPDRGKNTMLDPFVSFIEIYAVPDNSDELLYAYIDELKEVRKSESVYTRESMEAFAGAYDMICLAAESAREPKEYFNLLKNLKQAEEKLETIMVYENFDNERKWTDTSGDRIQAHGGQVQQLTYVDRNGQKVTRWWWVGEDKTKGAHGGVCAYSSDDLYNWDFEGKVLRNVESRDSLDTDSYFTELYAGYTKEQLDNVYKCLNAERAIIERPKMLYNEKTGLYVLWFHADGPTETSNSSYAAASAGLAVSEHPYGPFRFVDRYRLNTCPEDQKDFYPQSKGMARDMNLFVDDDKTAYIIYSSEENLTLYISKLNEEYTYLATDPKEAVYGRDFIRLYPGSQREAPALFKQGEYYYLMSSGCTGWAPNQARYYRATSVLGEWENMGDPCIGDTAKNTFTSQSTCIFKCDDKIIYMGDRWFSDNLPDSRYIWLPVIIGSDNTMGISYVEEWTK